MKKITFIIALLLSVNSFLSAQVTSLSGSGTAEDPYLIGTAAELRFLSAEVNKTGNTTEENTSVYQKAGKVFKQTADLDMSGTAWTPIGAVNNSIYRYFRGIYDGNDYKITNLYAGTSGTRVSISNCGLFGIAGAGAIIKNIIVENATFYLNASYSAALLVGTTLDVTVENCKVSGTIDLAITSGTSTLFFYGGLNGLNTDGTIINSSVDVTLNVVHNISKNPTLVCGGLVGRINKPNVNKKADVVNCYSMGSINVQLLSSSSAQNQFYAGGLVGQFVTGEATRYSTAANNVSSCEISVVDNTTAASGNRTIGGISGDLRAYNTIRDCISLCPELSYTGSTSATPLLGRITGRTETNFVLADNYSGDITASPAIDLSTDIGATTKNGANLGSNNPPTLLEAYVAANPTYSAPYGNVSLKRWEAVLATNTSASSLTNCENCDVKVTGGTLTIDEAKKVKSVTLDADTKLDLSTNTLTVSGDLKIKASKTAPASIKVSNAMTVGGSFSFEKTFDNTKWYWVSFPSEVAVNDIAKVSGSETLTLGTNWWIKYYDGATRAANQGTVSNWKNVTAGETLTANKGYVIGLANELTGDYVLSFPLNKNLVQSAETARTVAVVAHGEGTEGLVNNHKGWNLVGIPYLSSFAGSGVGATYLTFHNGTTYVQSEKANVTNIYPFESFFVQASTAGTTANLSFDLSNRQLVKGVANDSHLKLPVQLTTATGTDITTLLISDTYSNDYVINQDLEKWLTTGTEVPQLYSLLEDTRFAFNALPAQSVAGLPLGVYTKNAGEATISLQSVPESEYSEVLLTDNTTSTTTNLLTGSYTYDAPAGTEDNRFTIALRNVTTEQIQPGGSDVRVIGVEGGILVKNLPENSRVRVFDLSGRLLTATQSANRDMYVPLANKGYCSIQIIAAGKTETVKYLFH